MNAIDTNILIRYLTQDDIKQGEVAKKQIESGAPVFVTHIVFIEAVWVLKSLYGLDRKTIAMALEEVINNDFFKIEKSKMMSKALQEYRNGFDLADMLIGYNAEGNACHTTFTFDKKASKHRVFSLLKT